MYTIFSHLHMPSLRSSYNKSLLSRYTLVNLLRRLTLIHENNIFYRTTMIPVIASYIVSSVITSECQWTLYIDGIDSTKIITSSFCYIYIRLLVSERNKMTFIFHNAYGSVTHKKRLHFSLDLGTLIGPRVLLICQLSTERSNCTNRTKIESSLLN